MPKLSCGRDCCDACGGPFTSATFRGGRLTCSACLAAIEASKGKSHPVQQALDLGPVAQPRPAQGPKVLTDEQLWGDHQYPVESDGGEVGDE